MVTKDDATSVILQGYATTLYNRKQYNADLGNGADGWQATASDSPIFLLMMRPLAPLPFNLPGVACIVLREIRAA